MAAVAMAITRTFGGRIIYKSPPVGTFGRGSLAAVAPELRRPVPWKYLAPFEA